MTVGCRGPAYITKHSPSAFGLGFATRKPIIIGVMKPTVYLVTWNFAHLANAAKRRHIEVLNRRLYLPTPVICSPDELMMEATE